MSKLRLVPSAGGTPLELDGNKVVGRDASADVVVDDASVSRKHARLELKGEAWTVADQASANGTFINGQRVTEAGLRHGQTLRFGDVSYKVEIEGGEEDLAATRLGSIRPPMPPPTGPAAARPPAAPGSPSAAPAGAAPKKGKSPMVWIGGCCGCLLLLGILIFILSLVGAIAIPSLGQGGKEGESAPAAGTLRLDATRATKTRDGDATKVEFTITVTGYGTRPSGSNFEFDLQEDIVTLNESGVRMENLSKENIERRNNYTSSAAGDPQAFTSTLTISEAPPGRYSVRASIIDHVSGATSFKNVPFTLP